MSFELNQLKTNEDGEQNGVWTDKVVPGAKFLIARIGNDKFQEAFTDAYKPYQDSGVEMPKDEKERVSTELTANYILLGWEGVTLDGKALPYSVENAVKVLTTFKELRGKIITFASQFQNYKDTADKEAEKN